MPYSKSRDRLPDFEDALLQLEGWFSSGANPVQAWGTVANHPFYFEAILDRWRFGLSFSWDLLPADVSNTELGKSYFSEGTFGVSEHDAGNMPPEAAEKIIRTCAAAVLDGLREESAS